MRQHLRIHKAEPNKGILDYSHLLDAPAGKQETDICISKMEKEPVFLALMWQHVPIRLIMKLRKKWQSVLQAWE